MISRSLLPVARRISTLYKVKPWPGTVMCVRSSSVDTPPCGYVHPTMDEMPLPCGDWCEDYANKQRRYNLHLIFGVGFFTITMAVAYYSGLMWCNLMWPEVPGPRRPRAC